MNPFDEYKSAVVEWISSDLAEHLLPFAIVAVDCGAGAALGPGWPREFAAGLALFVAAVFAWKFDTAPRLLLLAFTAGCCLMAFDREQARVISWFSSVLAIAGLPAITLHLLMGLSPRRHPLMSGLRLYHIYAPMAALVLAETLGAAWLAANGSTAKLILLIYWLYTGILLFFLALGFLRGLAVAPTTAPKADTTELVQAGKFTLAGRRYAEEGDFAKGAEMAQKAGDWRRSAEMYARAGDFFKAAEMFYRSGDLDDALINYERSGTPAAAARICLETGRVERASELLAKCGEFSQAVDVLEKAARTPSVELYLKAGRFNQALQRLEERGEHMRAAEIAENELHDLDRAVRLYELAGAHRKAGELLEALGKKTEAIDAYAKTSDMNLHAAQLCYDSGDLARAKSLLEKGAMDDEQGQLLLARIYWQERNVDDAIRVLQKLKRGTEVPGAVPYLLGRCFMTKGMPELAEVELRTARAQHLDPSEETDAAYYLARVLEVVGKPSESIDIYQEIVRKDFHYRDVQARYQALKQHAPAADRVPSNPPTRLDDFDA